MVVLAVALWGCVAEEPALATFSGAVVWLRPEHTGVVRVGVEADEPGLALLREQALGEGGRFGFVDLPVGEAALTGEIRSGDTVVCDLHAAPRRLGPEGVELLFEWCGGFD
jgi:hypothetical protein